MLAASSVLPAVFALIGTLVGGMITALVSLRVADRTGEVSLRVAEKTREVSLQVAEKTREAAERSWMRDSRRQIYDRFLTKAQQLQIACEACEQAGRDNASVDAVRRAYDEFFQVYVVVQTVGQQAVVEKSRIHGYRLQELRDEAIGAPGELDPPDFTRVSELVRYARHDTVDAMRNELGMDDSARPPDNFNAFEGTDLEKRFRSKERRPAIG